MIDVAVQARLLRRAVPAVLLLALILRWPMPWPAWTHFDETAFVVLPLGFWGGDLNPHYFNYPTFHFYLTSLCYVLAWLVGWGAAASESAATFVAWQYLLDGRDMLAVARLLNVLFSTATVAAVALLARRLYDPVTGLIAATVLAVMPLATRFAPVANTDTPALFWSAVALLWAVRAGQTGGRRDLVLAGICTGLAAATKYPAVLVAVPVAVAQMQGSWRSSVRRVTVCALTCVVAFGLATPYVLLDVQTFWRHFSDMAGTHLLDSSQASSMALVPRAVFYAVGTVGLPALAMGLLMCLRNRGWQDWAVLSAAVVPIGLLWMAESTFLRYALPLALPLALLVARGLVAIRRPVALLLVSVVVLAQPLLGSVYGRSLLSGPDTRTQAQAWLKIHEPAGTWLQESDSACGRIDLLRPEDLFLRQAHFLRSYGIDRLHRAYTELATRPDLPSLFPPGNGQQGLRISYQHPVCGHAGEREDAAPAVIRFEPGHMAAPDFDPQDWYFVPVRQTAQRATGPQVTIQPLSQAGPTDLGQHATTQTFLEVMGWTLQASMTARNGDSAAAIGLYQRVLATWTSPAAVLGDRVTGSIHRQLDQLQRQNAIK